MGPLTIPKPDVPAFLTTLAGSFRVIAPRRVAESDVVFADFDAGLPLAWDFVNTVVPPKALFFPGRETLLHVQGSRRPTLRSPVPEAPVAIFGMRSCDATGAAFLERFFAGRGFEDETVVGRTRAALTMTLACHTPGPDCFCVCCEGGPWLTSGFDIQFTDLGDRLLADVRTRKGRGGGRGRPRPCSGRPLAEDLDARRRQVATVDAAFERRLVHGGRDQAHLARPASRRRSGSGGRRTASAAAAAASCARPAPASP